MLSSMQSLHYGSVLFSVLAGVALIVLRLRASRKPATLRKIVIPPLGMATGFIMFAFPQTHIPWLWAFSAFGIGLLIFAFPLIVTTRMERRLSEIYVIRSKAFVVIIVGLLIIRLALRGVIGPYLSMPQTGAVFYLLAFGMIVPWRIAMLGDYLALRRGVQEGETRT